MAQTITPAVSGAPSKWIRNVGLHWLGLVIGGLTVVALSRVAFHVVAMITDRQAAIGLACVLAGVGVCHEVGLAMPLPYARRQVPVEWRTRLALPTVSFVYGASLGVGFLTLFTSSAQFALVLLSPFAPFPVVLAAIAMYGVGKTLVVLVVAGTSTHAAALERLLMAVEGFGPPLTRRLIAATATTIVMVVTLPIH